MVSLEKRRHLVLQSEKTSSKTSSKSSFPNPPNSSHSPIVFSSSTSNLSDLQQTMLYTMETNDETGEAPNFPTIPAYVPSLPTSADRILDEESHQVRLDLQDRITGDKGTDVVYARHHRNYEDWWQQDQTRRVHDSKAMESSSTWECIGAHPITATKVSIFLKHETTRPKLSSGDSTALSGTRLGPSAVKQCISALEYFRAHFQHRDDYRACPEAQKPLRDDIRIRTFEKAAQATEPERLSQVQQIKADGVQSDTFTPEQLSTASLYFLEPGRGSTPLQITKSVRDRAMLLLTTTMAFRGDNLRNIGWSDLYMRDILLSEVGPEAKVPALVIFSNQGKENTTGRHDEHGAFRHRITEHCGIGALALYFFTLFHVTKIEAPDFLPDYSQSNGNVIGFRKWYLRYLFPGKDDFSAMTFENHRKRVNKMKKDTNIEIVKVTHAGRPYTVKVARDGGASVAGAMALGLWMQSSGGSFRPCYDRALPVDALLGAAGFNAQNQNSYLVARDVLVPPSDLISQIFPWVEEELRAYEERYKARGKAGQDHALTSFLSLLVSFRRILLQDAAILYTCHPNFPIFQYPPFSTAEFRQFSASASSTIRLAEEAARHRLEHLPETMAMSLRGIITTSAMQQEIVRQSIEATHIRIDNNIGLVKAMVEASIMKGSSTKKRKAIQAALETPPVRPAPSPPTCTVTTPPTIAILGDSEPSSPQFITIPDPLPIAPSATVSLRGNIYNYATFPLSTEPDTRTRQLEVIAKLEDLFTYECIARHQFEWEEKQKDWLPEFNHFWSPVTGTLTIEDIWRENRFGIDGMFSIQEMTSRWGARWKRNTQALKTEASRRNKVIKLIEVLSSKPNWNTDLAFRFLNDQSPLQTKSARAFSDYLNKTTTAEIIKTSALYP
jgi:hypothetical protein